MLNNFLKDKEVVFWNLFRDNINGHIFECLDYYWLFRSSGYKAAIVLIYDYITKEDIEVLIRDKYNFTNEQISDILQNIYIEEIKEFVNRRIINGANCLCNVFVEAHDIVRMYLDGWSSAYALNNMVGLRCGIKNNEFKELSKKNVKLTILQDYRIYGEEFFWPTIDHKKRIMFEAYKEIREFPKHHALIYLSTEVRTTSTWYLKETMMKYPYIKRFYITVPNVNMYDIEDKKVIFVVPPMHGFQEKFDTLIYIPIERKFDCSPRLVTECIYYNKMVYFHDTGPKYRELDKGLYWRWKDIQEDFPDLILTRKDELFQYVFSNKQQNI